MKILIVNTLDTHGGAARAAHRLHEALLVKGVESNMLVRFKVGDGSTVFSAGGFFDFMRPYIDNLPLRLYPRRTKSFFSPAWLSSRRVLKKIAQIDPDIVHLHWTCLGMMSVEDLARINKPIVWSLHDNWAFTGGCHVMWDCKKYKKRCGSCPLLGSSRENDLSRKIFVRKKKVYPHIKDLTIVGLSKWLMKCSQKSVLLGDKEHVSLPNPIDTGIFTCLDKKGSRKKLRLPLDKKLVLFGAMSATSDVNKGFENLSNALEKLKDENIELVVFGDDGSSSMSLCGFPVHYCGQITDDEKLVRLYNAADVMVVPSLQENLSNAIMESMACATPVVGFNIGGNGDMVDHSENGYLAQPFDTSDLSRGIEWVLYNDKYDTLCARAREKVLREFDSRVVAKKYIDLYSTILSK